MPIGFWAVNRNGVKELFEFRVADRRPKWKLSIPDFEKRIDNIVRRLPSELDNIFEQVVLDEINKGEKV